MEYFKGIINIEASKSMTKEQVYEQLKGKLDVDFDTFYLETFLVSPLLLTH